MQGPFLASYEPVSSHPVTYGIRRIDHAVGNVPVMCTTVDYIKRFSGFHEFAEFTAEVRMPVLSRLDTSSLKMRRRVDCLRSCRLFIPNACALLLDTLLLCALLACAHACV